MNKKLLVLGTALLAISLLLNFTEAQSSRRPTYDLNVRKPIDAIVDSVKAFIDNLDVLNLVLLIIAVVPCLSGLLPTPPESPSAVFVFDAFASANLTALSDPAFQQEIASKLEKIPIQNILENIKLEGYCSTPAFEEIHNYVWKEDDQFPDLLAFLFRFGSPDIYDIIKALYVKNECPQKLIDELPTAPPPKSKLGRTLANSYPDIRGQMLRQRNSLKQDEPKCDIAKIIELVPKTGVIQLVQLLNTVYREFTVNPSTHFLLGKIQEPIKGNSVRKFKKLPAVRDILAAMHEQLKNDPTWGAVFKLIKDATGIDFGVINPIDLILNIVIFLIWPL